MILAAGYHIILAVIFAFIGMALMGVILLQRGRGVGLAGAFGGAGGHTAFGAKTGDMLTWATIVGLGLFLLVAILLNYAFVPDTQPIKTQLTAPPVTTPDGGGGAPISGEQP